jgi:uncharacterized membrane protein YhfC
MTIQWPLAKLRAVPRDAEIAAGVAAAQSYEGWESGLIGEDNNRNMVVYVITTADAGADQTAVGRQVTADAALTKIITDAGYANEVSAAMIAGIVAAVLQAVATVRAGK